MDQTFITPINEPYHHHYNYYSPATINGQKSKKGNTPSTTSNTSKTALPSKSTNSVLNSDHHQVQNNDVPPSLYNNNNNGSYNNEEQPHLQDKQSSNVVLPPLSSLLPPPTVDIHSTTKYSSSTNYSHMNNMPYLPPNVQNPFNANPIPHDVYLPMSSPVSNTSCSTTESYSRSRRNSTTSLRDTPDNQKKHFQNMITRVIAKEDKRVVKISQQQQTNLLMKVLRFNQLKLAQMIAHSNKTHHTISAQLLDNDRKLDVYVLARKKNIGVNSASNTEKRVDCFRLDDYSFNIVVLEQNKN